MATERRPPSARLAGAARARWNLFHDEVADGVLFLDPELRLLWLNRHLRTRFGLGPLAAGCALEDVLPPAVARSANAAAQRAVARLRAVRTRMAGDDDVAGAWTITAHPVLRPADGERLGLTLTLRERSAAQGRGGALGTWAGSLREALRERAGAGRGGAQRARSALATQAELFAELSHELRNPLAAIGIGVDLWRLEQPRESWAQEMMTRNLALMSRLLDDLLDLSRLEQGGLRLRAVRLDVRDVLERVAALVGASGEVGDRQIDVAPGRGELLVQGDPVYLERAIRTVLGVVVNITPDARRVTVAAHPDEGAVLVAVGVNGDGRGAEAVARLLDPPTPEGPPGPGSGIGLALTRRIVDLHHGTLRAARVSAGRGAAVLLRLPGVAAGGPTLEVE